jgi:uncharacterized membrane protein
VLVSIGPKLDSEARASRGALATALGRDWKGKLSPILYLTAIPLAFVSPALANTLYVLVALIWLVPDRRIERHLTTGQH